MVAPAFTTSLTAPVLAASTSQSSFCAKSARIQNVAVARPRAAALTMKANGENPNLPKIPQGFTDFSEMLNGRAAMLGFTLALVTELITGRGMLGQMHSVVEIVNMASALGN